MADWYYRDFDDVVGPVPPDVMRQRVADGTITAETTVRREDGDWLAAANVPGLLNSARLAARDNDGDSTGGLIPYKNPQALIAYYLGVFSLVPCFGLPLGIAAVVLGILGLRKRKQNPAISGIAHAWVGIILGGLMSIVWIAAAILMVVVIQTT